MVFEFNVKVSCFHRGIMNAFNQTIPDLDILDNMHTSQPFLTKGSFRVVLPELQASSCWHHGEEGQEEDEGRG